MEDTKSGSTSKIKMAWSNDDSVTVIIGGEGKAFIHLHSNPSGASVSVNGQYIGVSPIAIQGDPDTYHIVMSLAGYNDCSKDITVVANQEATVTCNMTQGQENGTLIVNSTPTGAEVYLDQNYVGTTPYTDSLPAGTYVIEIKKTGYNAFSVTKTIVSNQTTTVDANLTEKVLQSGVGWVVGLALAGAFLHELTKKNKKNDSHTTG